MSYPQQPPYGPPPPGHGYQQYPPQRPSTAIAYVAVVLFVLCSAMSYVFAIISWDGSADSPDVIAAVIGIVFSEDLTGNVDFAIAATMTVASTVLLFALMLLARLDFVRWILVVLGGIVTAYYVYAAIYLLSHDAAEVIGLAIAALLLWAAATALVALPATGRAMRGHQLRYRQPGPPPPPQYGGYYGTR